jgi:uncharacterized membrane protein (DUF106 family)
MRRALLPADPQEMFSKQFKPFPVHLCILAAIPHFDWGIHFFEQLPIAMSYWRWENPNHVREDEGVFEIWRCPTARNHLGHGAGLFRTEAQISGER